MSGWPYAVGAGFGLLGIAYVIFGHRRLREVEEAIRRGDYVRATRRSWRR